MLRSVADQLVLLVDDLQALEAVVTASGSNKGQSTASIASDQSQLLVRSPDGVLAGESCTSRGACCRVECQLSFQPLYTVLGAITVPQA
jgi:hypothetical protein